MKTLNQIKTSKKLQKYLLVNTEKVPNAINEEKNKCFQHDIRQNNTIGKNILF